VGSCDGLRFAIVSSPRSGNMWLRRLLATLYDIQEVAVDTPAAVVWRELPPECVLQLHCHPTSELLDLLHEHGFATVALARHPLDILVSILHFAQHEARTARWLNGEGGNEGSLVGVDPVSEAFRRYATGTRAHALLGLTVEWWRSGSLDIGVSYEQLVAAPEEELARIEELIVQPPRAPLAEALALNSLERLRSQGTSRHFWRGQPGLWRRLIPVGSAVEIAAAHRESFETLGYEPDADPGLTPADALANWHALAQPAPEREAVQIAESDDRLITQLELSAQASESFIESAYRLILRRAPDAVARARSLDALEQGTLSRATLLLELVTSSEAERLRTLDDGVAFAAWARAAGERPRLLEGPPQSHERVVAIPWALARIRKGGSLLDVGYSHAEPAYLAALISLRTRRLVGVDLLDKPVPGIETVAADVRDLPFRPRSFDSALCLDTLQHVGQDNRLFGLAFEQDETGPLEALRELRRVVAFNGRVLVSVPCGEPQDLGWLIQWDPPGWNRLFLEAGFFIFEQEIYELTATGWRSASGGSSSTARYGEHGPAASAVLCAELRPGRARQVARRAAARLLERV
jgi:SAM-dependent methyltransferase